MWASSGCGAQGYSLVVVCTFLTVGASPVAVHGLSCLWDLPRPGIEPVSPALAGGFLSTVPPGKSNDCFIRRVIWLYENTIMLS